MKFHLTTDQKLACVGFALTIFFGFLPFADPDLDHRIADIGIAASIVAVVFLLRHDAISIWETIPGVPRYLPLHEAARRYHEAMLNSLVGQTAVATSNSPDDVLNWYGFWFVGRGLPIYGSRPPSRLVEVIPPEKLLSGGSFTNGARSFDRHHDPAGSYTGLVVLKKDFRALWPQLIAADLSTGGAPEPTADLF